MTKDNALKTAQMIPKTTHSPVGIHAKVHTQHTHMIHTQNTTIHRLVARHTRTHTHDAHTHTCDTRNKIGTCDTCNNTHMSHTRYTNTQTHTHTHNVLVARHQRGRTRGGAVRVRLSTAPRLIPALRGRERRGCIGTSARKNS